MQPRQSLCGLHLLQGELGVASALLGSLAGRAPRLHAGSAAEETRLAGQLRLLGALVCVLTHS
jgi:hypothetical protein